MSDAPADTLKRVEARIALAESYVTTYRGCLKHNRTTRLGGAVNETYRQQYEAWLTQLLDAKAEWHKLKREEAGRKILESLGVNPAASGFFGNYLKGLLEKPLAQYYNLVLPA